MCLQLNLIRCFVLPRARSSNFGYQSVSEPTSHTHAYNMHTCINTFMAIHGHLFHEFVLLGLEQVLSAS